MRLSIFKLILVINFAFLVIFCGLVAPKTAGAVAPWSFGKVVSATGANIPGVWVSWYDYQDSVDQAKGVTQQEEWVDCGPCDPGDCSNCFPATQPPYNIRYQKTFTDGYFQFAGWNVNDCSNQDWKPSYLAETVCGGGQRDIYNTWIDTDLNGANDARRSTTWHDRPSFGCARPNGIMKVTKPYNWTGTFTKIVFQPGYPYYNGLGNSYGWQDMGAMYFIPNPTGLTASCPLPGNSANLTWDTVANAEFYMVKVNDGAPVQTSAPYLHTTTPGSSYSWSVAACRYDDAGGCTRNPNNGCPNPPSYSCTDYINGSGFTCLAPTATPTLPPVPPNPPISFSGTCPGAGTTATLAWNPPTGSYDGFHLKVDKTPDSWNSGCNPVNEGDICTPKLSSTERSYSFTSIPGAIYKAWLSATLGALDSTASEITFTCANPPTPTPWLKTTSGDVHVNQ